MLHGRGSFLASFFPLFFVWIVSKIIWRPVTRCSQCGNIIGRRPSIVNKQAGNQKFAQPLENVLAKLDEYSPESRQNTFVFVLMLILFGSTYFIANKVMTHIDDSDKTVKILEPELAKTPNQSTIAKADLTQIAIQKTSGAETLTNPQNYKLAESGARERLLWAGEYESRKRKENFVDAKCFVSGKDNTILTLQTKAVVDQSSMQILGKSGYFDEVFNQGFKKLILIDTVGHQVSITHSNE